MDQGATTLLRFPDVRARVGLSRTTVFCLIREGKFPRPITLSRRTVAWDSRAIDGWIADRIASASDASARAGTSASAA